MKGSLKFFLSRKSIYRNIKSRDGFDQYFSDPAVIQPMFHLNAYKNGFPLR
jgi:hypothetical protein